MKKLMLCIVAVVFTVSSFAQDGNKVQKTPEEIANKRADKLKTELTLSDDQRAKEYALELDRIIKVRATRAKYPTDKKAAHKEIKPINEASQTALKEILTADQITKWEALKKAQKEKRKGKKAAASDDEID
ncbi:MAG: hypothetical protein HQ463_01855 [Bacteroidetes bacterium]|nr:hypothetical protein [Bacteroidota bacterium]